MEKKERCVTIRENGTQKLEKRNSKKHEEHQLCLSAEVCEFLERHVAPIVLEVFPEWQGVLLTCPALDISVWIVRTYSDGQWLYKETGQPALLLSEVLAHKGRCFAEIWGRLQSCLIISQESRKEPYE
jgi:hypothetical protein